MAVYNSSYRMAGKKIREKTTDRRIDSERGKIRNQSFVTDPTKAFEMARALSGISRVREKGKITSTAFLTKAILTIRGKVRRIEMFSNLPVKD